VEPDIPEVLVAPEAGPSQATDLPKHAVVRIDALMFYKMLFILNVVINVIF